MHIGLVIYGTLDTISGGYLYDRKLVEYLRRQGDAVEIISLPWRNYARHLTDNLSPSLFRHFQNAPFDLLIQDELNHPSLFWINRKLRGVVRYPIVSIVHHLRSSESHPIWQPILYRWVERQYLASVDDFIFNSETTRLAVSRMLDQVVVENSVVAYPAGDRFSVCITDEQIIARAHQPGWLRLIFVGNLIPRKGLDSLLGALAYLPPETFQLTIVGSPPADDAYARAIRRKITENQLTNVRWSSRLTDAELAAALANSQALVVPSLYEGFGIVYLEGMSFGLPAIGTTAGAASEIISDGDNGFLVPPEDAVALAARLQALIRDRDLLSRMSLAARKRFNAHPTWNASTARIRQALSEMRR